MSGVPNGGCEKEFQVDGKVCWQTFCPAGTSQCGDSLCIGDGFCNDHTLMWAKNTYELVNEHAAGMKPGQKIDLRDFDGWVHLPVCPLHI